MPRPTGDDERSLREVDGGLCFFEKIEGLGANLFGVERHGHGVDRGFAGGCAVTRSAAKGAGLKRSEPWGGALEGDVGGGFALEHLADKDEFAGFVAVADAVADHAFAELSGELGSEVADLIGVREEDQVGLGGFDDLLQRDAVTVGRVGFQQVVFDEENFGHVFGREFVREAGNTFSNDQAADCAGRIRSNLLRGGERFEAGVVPLALALFGDDQNFHR